MAIQFIGFVEHLLMILFVCFFFSTICTSNPASKWQRHITNYGHIEFFYHYTLESLQYLLIITIILNTLTVPFYMHSVYLKFNAFITVDTSKKTMGYKEGSGFTHAHNDEPITFNPMEAYEGIRDVSNGMRTKLQY